MTARRYKIGLIRCLADRIWKICEENDERMAEIEKLKIILVKNEYPIEVIERSTNAFIESKTRNKLPQTTVPCKPIFLKLPYVNKKCEDYAFRLYSARNSSVTNFSDTS